MNKHKWKEKRKLFIEIHLFREYIFVQTSERKNKNIFYFYYLKKWVSREFGDISHISEWNPHLELAQWLISRVWGLCDLSSSRDTDFSQKYELYNMEKINVYRNSLVKTFYIGPNKWKKE
jgi:hypothetical protein